MQHVHQFKHVDLLLLHVGTIECLNHMGAKQFGTAIVIELKKPPRSSNFCMHHLKPLSLIGPQNAGCPIDAMMHFLLFY